MKTVARSLTSLLLSSAYTAAFAGGVLTQLTSGVDSRTGQLSVDDAGSVVIGSSTANIGGQNPGLIPSIYSWNAASGEAALLWSFPAGVRTISDSGLSDDGAWLAFLSRADLTGGNPSGVEQLFLRRTDGSETRQLTALQPGEPGFVQNYALAGSGNRAAFVASTDPLGTNPSHQFQLFVVDADGANLSQLTNTSYGVPEFSISDDGTRVAFASSGDLTGGNPDNGAEIFAIDADGSNLHQLTSGSLQYATWGPRVSGSGNRVVFESVENYGGQNPSNSFRTWVIEWSGVVLRVMPALDASYPSITDDGQDVYYTGFDFGAGNGGIWRVTHDGFGTTKLTTLSANNFGNATQVSGGGFRVIFTSYEQTALINHGDRPVMAMTTSGGDLVQLTADDVEYQGDLEMTADGSRLVFTSSANPLGTNPSRRLQVFRMQSDGTGLVQVTAFTDGDAWKPSISDDGQKITFLANANPLGNNPNHDLAAFAIRADGTQLTLLEPPANGIIAPTISGNGTWVVFQSGGNGHVAQLMRMSSTGTSPLQITNDGDGYYKHPRVDANGVYVVYSNSSGIWRVTTNNTARQQITNYFAQYPDVSGNGTRYVWIANQNPLGSNPDGGYEIFSWDAPTNLYRQLTSLPANATLGRVRISRDGAYVTFFTNVAIFGEPSSGPYRLHVATGTIERIGGLGASLNYGGNKSGDFISISSNGSKMAFVTGSNSAGNNPDGSTELFYIDMTRTPAIRVSATSPSLVSWDADPHSVSYDVIRGEISNLAIAGSTVDLGPVSCLGDDLSAMDTSTGPYMPDPPSGQALFYLVRGPSGSLAGPGSYGQGEGGLERVAGTGECAP